MAETLLVELSPTEIETAPGGSPVEVVVSIQNLGEVVQQYDVDVLGLESDWYSVPNGTIGLFPRDREQVRVRIHPPNRPGVRGGVYPFRVRVRARDGSQETMAQGKIALRGAVSFQFLMTPRRQSGRRWGTYQLQIVNTGTADADLLLEAKDAEEACRYRFKDDAPLVPPGAKLELPLVVWPKKRPWIGPEKRYDFTVTARPASSTGQPQTVSGQFTHRPWLESWAPIRNTVILLVVVLALLFGIGIVIESGIWPEFSRRAQVAGGAVRGFIVRIPALGALLPFTPDAEPRPDRNCRLTLGFKDFADANPGLVGTCVTRVAYDGYGNAKQYTTNGVLFWVRATNTVYFFRDDCLFAFIDEKTQVMHGLERCGSLASGGP